MCGIAGIVDLRGEAQINRSLLEQMAGAIFHRGPDEDGYFLAPGVGMANRRLSIVGLADGQQPIFNEDRSVAVVYNGELFDHVEKRAELEERFHRFATSCDTEVLVHLWEEYGEAMLPMLRGQFAFALYDTTSRTLILARDRIGICPLHWARRGDRIYFGSEIKAILASGEVKPEADPRGLDHIFTFFAMPSRRTCFAGISAIAPGCYLKIKFGSNGEIAQVEEKRYWDLDFPDQGEEYDPSDSAGLLEEFEATFRRAVEVRLRADVPVVSYLSGGVDSTAVVATATDIRGESLPTFTIRIADPKLDETDRALLAAERVGCDPTIITTDSAAISSAYPELIGAVECPVVDTSCASLMRLAGEVRGQGYKVALTGEGADEALAGYPWFKTNRLIRLFDRGSFQPSNLLRRLHTWLHRPNAGWGHFQNIANMIGGPHAQFDLYNMISASRWRFYSDSMFEQVGDFVPYEDLDLNLERMKAWHPLNQSLYMGYKTLLPGLLMHHKGDRPAMHNSVETRYPFLDEGFIDFCAKLHPRWKLKGLRRDKHLLRLYAAKYLPSAVADRPKAMFRAPFAQSFFETPPAYVEQLLSEESLRKTGYFDPEKVRQAREKLPQIRVLVGKRLVLDMGLTAVMASQLWHHLYLGGGLCELPTWSPEQAVSPAPSMV